MATRTSSPSSAPTEPRFTITSKGTHGRPAKITTDDTSAAWEIFGSWARINTEGPTTLHDSHYDVEVTSG
jgi:hypothetical protein